MHLNILLYYQVISSIFLRYPSIENPPIAPGPITKYSISSFNNTEEIAFSKERTRVRTRECVPLRKTDLFALT